MSTANDGSGWRADAPPYVPHDFAADICESSKVTGRRILAMTAYVAFSAACVALLGLLWVSVNLLSFP